MTSFSFNARAPLFLGVCYQLSQYLSLDVTIIRIIFILLSLPMGAGVVIYFAFAFLFRALEPTVKANSFYAFTQKIFEQITSIFRNGVSFNPQESREKQIFRIICLFVGLYLLVIGIRYFLFMNSSIILNFLFLLMALSLFFKKRIDFVTILFFLSLFIFLELLFGLH